MMSRYQSFSELSKERSRGVDYNLEFEDRGSSLVVIAPHGGGIEPGTSEIARIIAGDHHSCYIFDGLRQTGNRELHLASTRFDEPVCLELVHHSQSVLAIHGCAGINEVVFVGGLDATLKHNLLQVLNRRGFDAQLDGSLHAGISPRNICNRSSLGKGAQLEISTGLRRKMFKGLSRPRRSETTNVFDEFVLAIQEVINDRRKSGSDPGIRIRR